MIRVARVAWIALVAACTDARAITVACGNGVLEPGEDCDVPDDPQCQMCGWRCDAYKTCNSIPPPKRPEDYQCGVDDFCHAPGGELGPQSGEPTFDATRFYETDVNGDGYGDVVGVQATALDVLYGDATGALSTSAATATATAAGSVATGDLGFGKQDVVYPTRDGLVAYASPFGALLPYGFSLAVEGASVAPLGLVPLDASHVVAIYAAAGSAAPQPTLLQAAVLDFTTPVPQVYPVALCDQYAASDFTATSLDSYDTTAAAQPIEPSLAFSFVASSVAGTPELCGVTIAETGSGSGAAAFASSSVVFPAPPSRAALAQLDASSCPSLVVSQGSAGFTRYAAARQGEGCVFSAAATAMPVVGEPGDTLVGHLPLSPAILSPSPSPLAADAVVTSSGVYGVAVDGSGAADPTQAPVPLYVADRPITAVSSGDLDGDGRIDGVALGSDSTIDLLYRDAAGGFIAGTLAAGATPSNLVVADLDGDGLADIAYVEQVPSGVALQIVYDTAAGPLPAEAIAGFTSIAGAARVALPDSADPDGTISGLVVALGGAVGDAFSFATVFHGSVDRTLIPLIDLRGADAPSSYRAVVAGHFVDNASAVGGAGVDLLAVEVPDDPTAGANLWQFTGAAVGSVDVPVAQLGFSVATGQAALSLGGPVVDCGLVGSVSGAAFCIDGSRFVDWPETEFDNPDDVLAVDAVHGNVFDIDPCSFTFALGGGAGSGCPNDADGGPGTAVELGCTGSCLPAGATVTEAFAADLDSSTGGVNQLVLAYSTSDGGGDVLACQVEGFDIGEQLVCTDVAAAIGPGASCSDAVAGQFSSPSAAVGTELAVLCGTTVYRVTTADRSGALVVTPTELTTLALAPDAVVGIGAADVNGDAVDDLLVLAIDPDGSRRLHVFLQLTSRQAGL